MEQQNIERILNRHNEKPARKPLDTSKLPVKEEHIYPKEINEEEYTELAPEVTDSLERIPAMVYIRRIIRLKYVLKSNIQIQHPERRASIIVYSTQMVSSEVSESMQSEDADQKKRLSALVVVHRSEG